MKKPTKSIITSSLLALAFGAMSVGTTFALFTSKAETTINVESGVIDLKAPISVVSAWELGNVPMVGFEFNYQNSIGGSITKDENNIVHLNKLAPGDGAIFALTPNNSGTNIKTKARLVVTLEGDLAGALNVEVKAGEDMVIGFNGAHTGYTPWEDVLVGENPTAFNVKVEFPDGDNGEILFGEDNHDNQYQNKTATLVIGYEAVQGNAQTDDILQVINTKLMTEAYLHGENETMYDALQDLSASQVAAIQERSYVWSVEADQFFKFDAAPVQAYKYFKMYDAMPTSQDYSIYATGTGWTTVGLTGVGFDAGDTSGITSVSYVGASDARTNIIRTNSATTAVNVDAPQDTISHYGTAGSLNINAIAGNSYHEYGKIAFAEIKTGRIALETGAKVEQIHLAVTGTGTSAYFNDITVAKAEGVIMPEFSRDPVSIPEGGRLVVALQEGTEIVTEQTELDYVWLTAVGVYEQVAVSDNKDTVTSINETEIAYAAETGNGEQKAAAQQICNNISVKVGDDEYTVKAEKNETTGEWGYVLVDENEQISEEYTVSGTPEVTVSEETVEEVTTTTTSVDVIVIETSSETVVAAQETIENGIDSETKEAAKEEAVEYAQAIERGEDPEDLAADVVVEVNGVKTRFSYDENYPKPYGSFDTAMDFAYIGRTNQDEIKVTLYKDLDFGNVSLVYNSHQEDLATIPTITFDLHGHSILFESTTSRFAGVLGFMNANTIIADTLGGGLIKVSDQAMTCLFNHGIGDLIINGATILNEFNNNTNSGYPIGINGSAPENSTHYILNAGTFACEYKGDGSGNRIGTKENPLTVYEAYGNIDWVVELVGTNSTMPVGVFQYYRHGGIPSTSSWVYNGDGTFTVTQNA